MTGEGADAAGDAAELAMAVDPPLPAAASAQPAAAEPQNKKNNMYTVAQRKWAVEVFNSKAGAHSYTTTARHLAKIMMAPSEFRYVTKTNVSSWVEASELGSLEDKRQRRAYVSEPCLCAMRSAAEAVIAAGHCIGSRMLRQMFLTVLDEFGEVRAYLHCDAAHRACAAPHVQHHLQWIHPGLQDDVLEDTGFPPKK
jgi:hypothetical protein